MAFIIQCDNRGCLQSQAALLDVESNEVTCAECGNVIKNVTHFAKIQLKSLGQTTKRVKSQQTYSVKCNNCSASGTPVLADNILKCKSCNKELTNLSSTFVTLLKNVLGNEQK